MNEKAGTSTFAQDEESCVVFGTPKEAIRMEAVDQILPLFRIPAAILSEAKCRVGERLSVSGPDIPKMQGCRVCR